MMRLEVWNPDDHLLLNHCLMLFCMEGSFSLHSILSYMAGRARGPGVAAPFPLPAPGGSRGTWHLSTSLLSLLHNLLNIQILSLKGL